MSSVSYKISFQQFLQKCIYSQNIYGQATTQSKQSPPFEPWPTSWETPANFELASPSTLSSSVSSKPSLSPSPCKLNHRCLCRPAPEVPRIRQAYSKHSDSVTVEFTEVAGATSYILRAESLDGGFFSETVVSSSPGTVVQLQPYTSYRLNVMSVNSGGQSQPSQSVQARTGNVSYPKMRVTGQQCRQTWPFFIDSAWRQYTSTDTFTCTQQAVDSSSLGRVKCSLTVVPESTMACYLTQPGSPVLPFTTLCHAVSNFLLVDTGATLYSMPQRHNILM